jgi:phosphoribosyl 1,2-cyclic phosphate phosphodiesterase
MELLALGSGGNTPIPTPTCRCDVCVEARAEGVPYARGGNSLYLPEIGAMVDAPEFAFAALNREEIADLESILLTHWHPDHVNGLRVVQSRDRTAHDGLVEAVVEGGPTIVTTRAVYERTCEVFGQLDHFVDRRIADVRFLDEEPLEVGGVTIQAIPYALEGDEVDATAFQVTDGDATLLIAADDARHLPEEDLPAGIDLAVLECGLFDEGPAGETLLTETDQEFLTEELYHDEVMARVDRVAPQRTL